MNINLEKSMFLFLKLTELQLFRHFKRNFLSSFIISATLLSVFNTPSYAAKIVGIRGDFTPSNTCEQSGFNGTFPNFTVGENVFQVNKNCRKAFTIMNTDTGQDDRNNLRFFILNLSDDEWFDFHFELPGIGTFAPNPVSSDFMCKTSPNGKRIDCDNGEVPPGDEAPIEILINVDIPDSQLSTFVINNRATILPVLEPTTLLGLLVFGGAGLLSSRKRIK